MKKLQGVWQFSSSKMTDTSGNELPDPITKASGMLMYSDNGYMAVQLSVPTTESEDRTVQFTSDYIAYYGTYEIISENGIIHHVINGNLKEMIGKPFEKNIQFIDDDCISLKNIEPEQLAIDIPIYRELFWRRMST